jgi:hypothetical protein
VPASRILAVAASNACPFEVNEPTMRTLALSAGLTVLACSAAACSPYDEESVALGDAQDGIVNGSVNNGDPAVVALTVWGQAFCSGTLITPTVVLTAAHCLPPNLNDVGIYDYTDISVFFGTYVGNGESRTVTDGWTDLAWNDNSMDHDIGLVRLNAAGPATPLPVATSAPYNNENVRVAGFGVTSENGSDSGTKRQGTAAVDQVYSTSMELSGAPSSTCFGDSGGTTIATEGGQEVVAGVHSRADCYGLSYEMRVDAYLYAINNFIGAAPSCAGDGQCASGCGEPDPDCPCAADGFCTGACGDPASDPDCPVACAADGFCDQGCNPADPDCPPPCMADGFCDPACSGDPDCASPGCAADGACDADCSDDPDCWVAGGLKEESVDGFIQESGCSLHGGGASNPWAWLLALALAAARRRS